MYFRYYRLWIDSLEHSLNSPDSEHALTVNMWKRPNGLEISIRGHLSCFSSFSLKLIWKMSPLVLGEILEVFVNILITDDKYLVQHCENLQLPIQIQ